MTNVKTIDEYIQQFPKDVQEILQEFRKIIQEEAPDAKETISYGLATFKLNGNLVHFGAFKEHIGFYPVPSGIEAFRKELAPYIKGKGTIQFQLNEPIPYDLVRKIVKYRVIENLKKPKKY